MKAMRILGLAVLPLLVLGPAFGQDVSEGGQSGGGGKTRLPPADIQLGGAIHKIGQQWWLDTTGTVNGASVVGSYLADLSDPSNRNWVGFAPFDSTDQKYQISKQYGDSFIFNVVEGIDMPELGIYFPGQVRLDSLIIDIDFCKGVCTPPARMPMLGDVNDDSSPIRLEVTRTSTRVGSVPVIRNRATGEELSPPAFLEMLVFDYGFTPEQAGRCFGNTNLLLRAEVEQALIEGAKRKLAATVGLAVPGMAKDEALALAERVWQAAGAVEGPDHRAFLSNAERILLDGGADPNTVATLIQGANDGETANPLATMQSIQTGGDPLGDLDVSFTATVEVSVSIPPFVTITVSGSATVSGPVSDYAAIVDAANKIAQEGADKLAEQIRERIKQLQQVGQYLADEVLSLWDWFWFNN